MYLVLTTSMCVDTSVLGCQNCAIHSYDSVCTYICTYICSSIIYRTRNVFSYDLNPVLFTVSPPVAREYVTCCVWYSLTVVVVVVVVAGEREATGSWQ